MRLPYPTPTSASASAVMRGNRKTDTRPEVHLRSELHRIGLRFRKSSSIETAGLRVRPDIVFTKQRLAVFVDGCFWHVCPEHGTRPQRNASYWSVKLSRNVERDRLVDRALVEAGWSVVRLWEHDVTDSVEASLQRVLERLGRSPALGPAADGVLSGRGAGGAPR